MELVVIDDALERAIDNSDIGFLKKRTLKKILDIVDGRLVIRKIALDVLPGFVKAEEIRMIKENLKERKCYENEGI